jgi:hypothetical protein
LFQNKNHRRVLVLKWWFNESVIVANSNRPSRNLIQPILVVLLVCLGFGYLVATLRRAEADRRARFFTLPDGNGGQLLGTGVEGAGFSTDNGLEQIARRFLPARFQHWLPLVFDFATNNSCDSNTLTVYMRFYPRSEVRVGVIGGFSSLGYRWGSYQTEDAGGFCYPRYPADMVVKHSRSGAEVFSFGVKAYPRQQREFLLRWWDEDGKLLAIFNVPNPIGGPFPYWRPLALPQTKTRGPVTLTLESLQESDKGGARWLRPQFRMTSGDAGWANAKVSVERLLDATGNESNPRLQAEDEGFPETPFAATNGIEFLSPREPAWNLCARVDRKRPQDFAANEKLVLTHLPLPAPGQFIPIDRSADCAGVNINALVLTGGGTFYRSNDATRFMAPPDGSLKDRGSAAFWSASGTLPQVWTWSSQAPFLLVETRNTQPGDEIQIYAFDESGREAKVGMNKYGNGGYEPTFVPPVGAKFLTITVAVNRPLSFEFLVNPADARPRNN